MGDKHINLIFDTLVKQASYESLITKEIDKKRYVFPEFVKIKSLDTKIIKLTIERER